MKILARHFEQFATFMLLLISEGVCWPLDFYLSGRLAQPASNSVYNTGYNVVLLVFVALAYLSRPRTFLPLLRSTWLVLMLIVLAYLSAFWSAAPDLVLIRATKVSAATLFGFYLIGRGDMSELVALFVKTNVVAVAASFLVAAIAPSLVHSMTLGYANAWRGAFTDKNELGMNAALGIIFALYAWHHRYGSRVISGIVIPLNAILLYLSNSKTPTLVLAVALYAAILGGAFRRRSGIGLAGAYVLALLGGLAMAALFGGLSSDVLAALGRDSTLTNRTQIWQEVLPYIVRRPWLGYGYETFWLPQQVEANQIWATLHWKVPHAHDLWLEIALSLGLVGVCLTALVWFTAFWRAARLLFGRSDPHVLFCLALLAAAFVENMTEYSFFRPGEILWILFAAVFVHLGRELLMRRGSTTVGSTTVAAASGRPAPFGRPAYGSSG